MHVLFCMAQNYCCHCSHDSPINIHKLSLLMGGFHTSNSKNLVRGSHPSICLPWISSDLPSAQIPLDPFFTPIHQSFFTLAPLLPWSRPHQQHLVTSASWSPQPEKLRHSLIQKSTNPSIRLKAALASWPPWWAVTLGWGSGWGPWSWCWTGKPDFWPTLGQV